MCPRSEDHVRRLQVAVADALAVEVRDGVGDPGGDGDDRGSVPVPGEDDGGSGRVRENGRVGLDRVQEGGGGSGGGRHRNTASRASSSVVIPRRGRQTAWSPSTRRVQCSPVTWGWDRGPRVPPSPPDSGTPSGRTTAGPPGRTRGTPGRNCPGPSSAVTRSPSNWSPGSGHRDGVRVQQFGVIDDQPVRVDDLADARLVRRHPPTERVRVGCLAPLLAEAVVLVSQVHDERLEPQQGGVVGERRHRIGPVPVPPAVLDAAPPPGRLRRRGISGAGAWRMLLPHKSLSRRTIRSTVRSRWRSSARSRVGIPFPQALQDGPVAGGNWADDLLPTAPRPSPTGWGWAAVGRRAGDRQRLLAGDVPPLGLEPLAGHLHHLVRRHPGKEPDQRLGGREGTARR